MHSMMLRLLAFAAAMNMIAAQNLSVPFFKRGSMNPLRVIFPEPYLFEFYRANDEQCDKMMPAMKAVERKLHTQIVKFDIWAEPSAYKLMTFLDMGIEGRSRCVTTHGLPLFYNRRNGQIICGATTEKNLDNWARGLKHEMVLPAPPSKDENEKKQRVTGRESRTRRQANEKKKKETEARKKSRATGLGEKPTGDPMAVALEKRKKLNEERLNEARKKLMEEKEAKASSAAEMPAATSVYGKVLTPSYVQRKPDDSMEDRWKVIDKEINKLLKPGHNSPMEFSPMELSAIFASLLALSAMIGIRMRRRWSQLPGLATTSGGIATELQSGSSAILTGVLDQQ
jgi:hypothetical protein